MCQRMYKPNVIGERWQKCYNRHMEIKVDRKAAVKKVKTLVLPHKGAVDAFRAKLERAFKTDFLPNRVDLVERKVGGVRCDILTPELLAAGRTMLYVHGGSFVGGSCASWRSFCATLAHASASRLIVPEFRLPPSHPFPCSVEDIESVFHETAADPAVKELALAADGSGAVLACAVLLRMKKEELSSIKKLVLFSPWLDLSPQAFTGRRIKDEVLTADNMKRAAELYTYSSNLENPLVSPLKASDEQLSSFPETYVQCGGKEALLGQSRSFCERLTSLGVSVKLDVLPGMMFSFQLADEFLTEAHEALERIGANFSERTGDTADDIDERKRLMRENNIAPSI